MSVLPNPLHPAVVHFPIVLILLGAVVALIAVFWRKGYVPIFAAALLALGALGSWVAMETGESDGGIVENSTAAAEQLIEAHEEWAERTLIIASIAAVIAVASAALVKFPRTARGIGVAAALAAGVASWAVYETGHRGGALVYGHGAGITVATNPTTGGAGNASETTGKRRDADDD